MSYPTPVLAALYRHAPEEARRLGEDAVLSLWEAAALGRLEVLESLALGGADLDGPAPDGFTALHLAAYFGQAQAVRWLLDHGADPESEGPGRLRPLHSAAAGPGTQAALACAEALLAAGAHPDALQDGGFSALHAAAQRGRWDLAVRLLAHGASPGLRTDGGTTPEDLAREGGHEELALWLRTRA